MSRSVVFVESNTTGTGRLMARAAARLGYRPLVLATQPARYPFFREDGVDVVEGDTHTESGVLAACSRAGDIAGITSSSDYFIAMAAAAAQELGLPGPGAQAVRSTGDKAAQRRILSAAGVPSPESHCVLSVEAAVERSRHLGFPVVLKPRSGSGSVGVRLCRDVGSVAEHALRLLAIRANERGMPLPEGALVERMVDGDEYSVEMFGAEAVGVTRKHLGAPPHFLEVGHDFPADADARTCRSLADVATAAVRALGLEVGPAHVELRVDGAGPSIIEVNPRLAGGYIPELVRRALGVDLIEATVRAAVGERPDLRARRHDSASIRFLVPAQEGAFREVVGLEDARALSCVEEVVVYRRRGEPLPLRGDFRDRVGHVLACGGMGAAVAKAADAALACLVVATDEPAPSERETAA